MMRLFGFFLTLFFFSFLLYAATLRHDWFTSARQLYLPAGIVTGALSGFVEAKVVTNTFSFGSAKSFPQSSFCLI